MSIKIDNFCRHAPNMSTVACLIVSDTCMPICLLYLYLGWKLLTFVFFLKHCHLTCHIWALNVAIILLLLFKFVKFEFFLACDARERQQWINNIRMISEKHSAKLINVRLIYHQLFLVFWGRERILLFQFGHYGYI